MIRYAIKRALLMVPTFFAISLLVFVVLNVAPGTPGAELVAAGEAGQNAQKNDQQRESYRIFKEQFNLDKPILFNTRYALSDSDIRGTLEDIIDHGRTVSAGRKIEAQEEIEDWGGYAVPGLMAALRQTEDMQLRAYASQRLAVNAKRPLKNLYSRDSNAAERAFDKEITTENNRIKDWYFEPDASADVQAGIVASWEAWFAEHQDRWSYPASKKAVIFISDTRFFKYWKNLIQLDFGVSHVDKRPVLNKVFHKLKYSITLSFSSVILIYLISVPLGVWSAVRQNTLADRIVTIILFMLYSLPSFFVGVVLLNFLTRGTPFTVFPTSGFESLDLSGMTTVDYVKDVLWHVILPITCLSYAGLAALSRYARTGLLDVIRSDYIRTARAKGLPEAVVIIKHAARNGMIPILTLLATLLPTLIGGSVVVEFIFGIPGMGLYMLESIMLRDYNAIMSVLLVASSLTLVGMLLSDLSYALVDPRITFD